MKKIFFICLYNIDVLHKQRLIFVRLFKVGLDIFQIFQRQGKAILFTQEDNQCLFIFHIDRFVINITAKVVYHACHQTIREVLAVSVVGLTEIGISKLLSIVVEIGELTLKHLLIHQLIDKRTTLVRIFFLKV